MAFHTHSICTEPQTPESIRLEPGDHLDRGTFHERYLAMPEQVRAELIEGVVHMPSPVQRRHGSPTANLVGWLIVYKAATSGVEAFDNTTIFLANDAEPQPDCCLLIKRECGGQTDVDESDYIVGAPELVVEVASSSASIDLYAKRRDYESAGVREYVIVQVRENRVRWLALREATFAEISLGADGVYRSEMFPGLWLDADALLKGDTAGVLAALRQGLASPEHAEFVNRLAASASN